ncbi:MAG: FG-GAP repeat domain-containing protein, partial [Terriglobales bacterium]
MGDLDGDGNLDLAVVVSNPNTSFNPGFVTILRGSANGSFTAQGNYGVGLGPTSIAVGDFTGDGRLDLAVGSPVNGISLNPQSEVSILVNNGSGGFQAGQSFVVGPLQTVPISIAVADFNDDARLDLAVAMNNTSNLVICQGNGDGTFSVVNLPGVGGNPTWVVAGDFNGDGKPDLMVANNADSTVSVLLGNGDETFSSGAVYPVGVHPTNLALADLNGDGKLDVGVVNNGDSNSQVFLGEGDGTFRSGSYRVGANPTGITSGDFNKDGFPDLAVFNGDATVSILLGDGHGGFKTVSPFPGCGSSSPLTGPIVAGDFNQDGKVDLVTSCRSLGSVSVFTGNGDGTFNFADAAGVGVVDG